MKEKILEVIVNNTQDAIEAEAGGADRLEVVRDLEHGGLTPDLEMVRQIASAVRLPLRVMLRENTSMALKDSQELEVLCRQASELNSLGVDGLVAGFIAGNQIDEATIRAIMQAAPRLKMTFHRAFDDLPDPLQAIATLKAHPQVDRILTIGGPGPWSARKLRLHHWQRYAAPEITILAGAGLLRPIISDLGSDRQIREIHVGRAARIPQETGGRVCRLQVAQLKGLSA